MSKLRNLKNVCLEIATILAADPTIIRLLTIDTPDAMTTSVSTLPNVNSLIQNNYISFVPPIESRIDDADRNTFITILMDSILFQETNNAIVSLYVSTNEEHALLSNNKNRLLELVDRIDDLLDGCKLTAAVELSITSANHCMLSDFHSAYHLNIRVGDQENGLGDI